MASNLDVTVNCNSLTTGCNTIKDSTGADICKDNTGGNCVCNDGYTSTAGDNSDCSKTNLRCTNLG